MAESTAPTNLLRSQGWDVVAAYLEAHPAWQRLYGEARVMQHPTNSVRRFGPAVDRFRTALAEGRIHHDGDADLRRHLLNARLVRGRGAADDDGHALHTLEKPGPGRLIDAAVASVVAFEAMATAPPIEPRFVSTYETEGLTAAGR